MPAKKKNAFFFFMAEMHREMKSQGKDVPFPQMQGIASPHWKAMTPEQKFKYQAMAKAERGEVMETPVPNFPSAEPMRDTRMNNQREYMADFDAGIRAKADRKRSLEDEVQSLRQFWPPGNALIHEHFYLVHAEYFVVTQEGAYSPCEISAVKMSMDRGIVAEYHTFIDPGAPPRGYVGEEKDRSERRHLIPTFDRFEHEDFDHVAEVEPVKFHRGKKVKSGEEYDDDDENNNEKGEENEEVDKDKWRRLYKNHANTYCRLVDFFDDGSPNRRAFTGSLDVDMVQAILNWIFDQARADLGLKESQNDLPKVLPLGHLLQQFYMHSTTSSVNFAPSLNSVERQLANEKWNYCSRTRCFFHERNDGGYCTLGQCKRWCYSIFDALTSESIYDFQLGINHLPPTSAPAFRVISSTESAPFSTSVTAAMGRGCDDDDYDLGANYDDDEGKRCRTDQRPEYRDGKNAIVHTERGAAFAASGDDKIGRISDLNNWPTLSQTPSSTNGASAYASSGLSLASGASIANFSTATVFSGADATSSGNRAPAGGASEAGFTPSFVSDASRSTGWSSIGLPATSGGSLPSRDWSSARASRVSGASTWTPGGVTGGSSSASHGFGRGTVRTPGESASASSDAVRRPAFGRGRARL